MAQTPHLISRLANLGYYEWDAVRDAYADVSEEYAALHGVTREAFLKHYNNREIDLTRWLHPDDLERYHETDRFYDANPQPYSIEYRILHDNDGVRHVIETLEPDWDDKGRVVRWFGIIQDITERVRSERARMAEQERAYATALSASAAKSHFIASMNHEFRTPMSAIAGFAQLLRNEVRGPLNKQQQALVNSIHTSSAHLLELLDQVLDLSRIERGEVIFKPEACDPQALIDSCITMSQTNAARYCVDIVNETAGQNLPAINVDPARTRQILLNLISNGLKYNQANGRVSISASVENGMMRFNIIDTGFGIEIDRQNEVFEPFNRIGFEESRIDGIGIGLAIARQFVEGMNGRIDFVSKPGEGSSFHVDLPLADDAEPSAGSSPSAT